MNTDLKKILRDALQYEFEHRFHNWLRLSTNCLIHVNNPKIKNSFDLRQALINCDDFEIEQEQTYIAYKIKENITSAYMKLEDYKGCAPIIEGTRSIIPNYVINLASPTKITANAGEIVIILGKFIDEYRLQAVCDVNFWEKEKCKPVKSREYVDGKEITKEKAMDLGFKYIKVDV